MVGLLGKLTGGPAERAFVLDGVCFIRPSKVLPHFTEIGDAPSASFTYGTEPNFATAFVNRTDGVPQGQKFPVAFPPLNVGPIIRTTMWIGQSWFDRAARLASMSRTGCPIRRTTSFSLQRQLSDATVLTLSYVGSQSHRLLATMESQPCESTVVFGNSRLRPG